MMYQLPASEWRERQEREGGCEVERTEDAPSANQAKLRQRRRARSQRELEHVEAKAHAHRVEGLVQELDVQPQLADERVVAPARARSASARSEGVQDRKRERETHRYK